MAEPSFFNKLKSAKIGDIIVEDLPRGRYLFLRISKMRFEFGFLLMNIYKQALGEFYFGFNGDKNKEPNEDESENKIWYHIKNRVLYDKGLFDEAMEVPEMLKFHFKHITSLDLAQDYTKNIVYIVDRMIRNTNLTMIMNGRVVEDRKSVIPHINDSCSRTRVRKVNPTINIKQAKAEKNKHNGLTLCAYNKIAEIEANKGEKQYILDYYGNPPYLHRLEVHQNTSEIKKFCKNKKKYQDIYLLYNQEFLTEMFYHHLNSILRFRKGRKILAWKDIIACNGRY